MAKVCEFPACSRWSINNFLFSLKGVFWVIGLTPSLADLAIRLTSETLRGREGRALGLGSLTWQEVSQQ